MFKKVHLKLTILCAVITVGILWAFTLIYLSISGRTLKESFTLSFQHDMDVLVSNIEQHPEEISNLYLQSLEQNNNYNIYLWDNGVPFLYNTLHSDSASNSRMKNVIEYYEEYSGLNFLDDSRKYTVHEEFIFEDADSISYNVCRASLYHYNSPTSYRTLVLLILSSRKPLTDQIFEQRLRFSLLCLVAAVLLTVFSWFFTGKLLHPIMENQQQQIRFVASASHELRTPIAVIRASIGAKAPGYENVIESECMRMGMLVDDMLSLTSMQRNNKSLNLSHVEPDTLILNIYEQMEPLALEKKITLKISIPDEVMPACHADKDKLMQVLYILVQNAISYTPEGGLIKLSVTSKKGLVTFTVSDNGTGISDKDKPHIFERFYRADTSRTQKNHFGLGLCIAKEIVDAHRGKISVSDTPGGGSTFR